jgi:hypothetical protein
MCLVCANIHGIVYLRARMAGECKQETYETWKYT